MPGHATRQRRRKCELLHTAHRTLAAYPAAYPATSYTSAQPSYSTYSRAAYRAVHRACLHICTTLLKTENCHNKIQLSRNFQNLHSNAVLICEYINIWSFKEVICVLVEEIFYERLCSCVKIAFLDVLICHSDHKFHERLCSCVKIASAE